MKKNFRKSPGELVNKIDSKGVQVAPAAPVDSTAKVSSKKVEPEVVQKGKSSPPRPQRAVIKVQDRMKKVQLTVKVSDEFVNMIEEAAQRINVSESDFSLIAMLALYKIKPEEIINARIDATDISAAPDVIKSLRITMGFKAEIIIPMANEHFDRKMNGAVITSSIWLASLPADEALEIKKEALRISIEEDFGIYRLR